VPPLLSQLQRFGNGNNLPDLWHQDNQGQGIHSFPLWYASLINQRDLPARMIQSSGKNSFW